MNPERIRRLLGETGWFILGSALSTLGSLVLVRALTEQLTPSEYGSLSLTLTLGVLICQVAFAGSLPGVMRYYTLAAERTQIGAYFRATCRATIASVLVSLTVGAALSIALHAWHTRFPASITFSSIIFSSLLGIYATGAAIQNAARQRRTVALLGGLDAWLKIGLTLLLIQVLGPTVLTVLLAYSTSILIVLALQTRLISAMIPDEPSSEQDTRSWITNIWVQSRPFVVFNVFTWAQASSDRWALELFATTREVGLYATLLQLGWLPIATLTGLAITFIAPIVFARSGDSGDVTRSMNANRLCWHMTFLALAGTAVAFVLATLLHRPLFALLVASEYRSVSHLLPWMTLGGGLFAASQVLSLKLQSDRNPAAMIIPKIVTALLGIGLNFLGAYLLGLPGVVASMVCFAAIHFLWLAWLSRVSKKSSTET